MGFDLIMRMQTVITIVTGVLTVVFIALVADHIHWHTVSGIHGGSAQAVIGALVFVMTGFGLGWVNAAADYSRYLPRRSSGRAWSAGPRSAPPSRPIFLLVFGLLLAGSSTKLSAAIGADPIGALATLLPTWFLVPFAIVAVLGLIGGSVLDIYSSGLALLTLGVRIPRYVAALIDGTVMTLGTIYVVFVAHNFIGQFEGFLITLGVPIAAWCGVMLADIALRRRDYAEPELFSPARPLRRHPVGPGRGHRGRHRARLGPGHQHQRELADLAGLPARPVRPGRQDRGLGLRQPRRAGRAGHRLRRAPGVRPGGRPRRGGGCRCPRPARDSRRRERRSQCTVSYSFAGYVPLTLAVWRCRRPALQAGTRTIPGALRARGRALAWPPGVAGAVDDGGRGCCGC